MSHLSFAHVDEGANVDSRNHIGAGESGKSTLIKQMRIIHKGGFPTDERYQTRAVIYSNLVVAFKVLLDIMNADEIEYAHENTRVLNLSTPILLHYFLPMYQLYQLFVR